MYSIPMKYIYGPVKSRRLGFSLGLSLTPHKVCDFDCVYCQLGKTSQLTRVRKEYVDAGAVLDELKSWLQNNQEASKTLEYITIAGSGEPTLNIKIGTVIEEIKRISSIPVSVITNASLLSDSEARKAILGADLIVPSLDSVIPEVFKQIDRPVEDIKIGQVIEGLINLRKEFRGKIWLEVMLVKGINDKPSQIRELRQIVDKINPDKIQLNSPVRTAAGENILPVSNKKLEKLKEILGEKCEVI